MTSRNPIEWVVYLMKPKGNQEARNAVCSQSEWEEMELAQPGFHTLIRAHITNEGEAERLARDLQTPPTVPKPNAKPFDGVRRPVRPD
jgi:hypothetical protein